MANALMAPGGGKVTTEGLAAASVIKGKTITVKKGASTVSSVTGTALPAGVLVWMDSSHTTAQVVGATTPLYTLSGASVTFKASCSVTLTAGMMTFTSANSTTTHTAKWSKNGTAVCTATATGTGAVAVYATKTATVSVVSGDVLKCEFTTGYPNSQMGYGHLHVK